MISHEDHQKQGLYGGGDVVRTGVQCANFCDGEYCTRVDAHTKVDLHGRKTQFAWCEKQSCGSTTYLALPLPNGSAKKEEVIEPHQQRVVDEKSELDVKTEKLRAFVKDGKVFAGLPYDEQPLLLRQLALMAAYSDVLGERIERFT